MLCAAPVLLLLSATPPQTDLPALRAFTKVIIFVKDEYSQPLRVQPQAIFVASLLRLQQASNRAVVVTDEPGKRVTVTVAGASKQFTYTSVDSLWKMCFLLKDVLDFVEVKLPSDVRSRPQTVEFAMIDGMLASVDSRARLLRPGSWGVESPRTFCDSGRTIKRFEFVDGSAVELPVRESCSANR